MVTIYPAVDEVLAIHRKLIAQFGGLDGVRDLGALEAALFRPQTGYYQDLVEEAAAMWESLVAKPSFRGWKQARLNYRDGGVLVRQ